MVQLLTTRAHQHFYELEELSALSLPELQSLWDSIPSEEQIYLVRVFERHSLQSITTQKGRPYACRPLRYFSSVSYTLYY
jgi:hypothetical protein